jgi:hypothetical protein
MHTCTTCLTTQLTETQDGTFVDLYGMGLLRKSLVARPVCNTNRLCVNSVCLGSFSYATVVETRALGGLD